MAVNAKTSVCLRFGPRYKNTCASVMVCGCPVNWVTSARYLGVYLESSVLYRVNGACNSTFTISCVVAIVVKPQSERDRGRFN